MAQHVAGYGKAPTGAGYQIPYKLSAQQYGGAVRSGAQGATISTALCPIRWGRLRGAIVLLDPFGRFKPGIPPAPAPQ